MKKLCILVVFPLVSGCVLFPGAGETFVEGLPAEAQSEILWHADFEDGTFRAWEDAGTDDYYSGGGIFVTDEENTDYDICKCRSYTGRRAAYATIRNAWRAENGNKAVRFMRWTDKAWNEDGDYFPAETYYSVWMYFPEAYNPTKDPEWDINNDGGWWNVFQFKSDNNAGSQPVVVLDLYYDEAEEGMVFGLAVKDYPDPDSDNHTQEYHEQAAPVTLPVDEWFHVEAYYKKTTDATGAVTVWQDGVQIFEVEGIITELSEQTAWGIGNYTDHIAGGPEDGEATVWFDDAVVATTRISAYLEE